MSTWQERYLDALRGRRLAEAARVLLEIEPTETEPEPLELSTAYSLAPNVDSARPHPTDLLAWERRGRVEAFEWSNRDVVFSSGWPDERGTVHHPQDTQDDRELMLLRAWDAIYRLPAEPAVLRRSERARGPLAHGLCGQGAYSEAVRMALDAPSAHARLANLEMILRFLTEGRESVQYVWRAEVAWARHLLPVRIRAAEIAIEIAEHFQRHRALDGDRLGRLLRLPDLGRWEVLEDLAKLVPELAQEATRSRQAALAEELALETHPRELARIEARRGNLEGLVALGESIGEKELRSLLPSLAATLQDSGTGLVALEVVPEDDPASRDWLVGRQALIQARSGDAQGARELASRIQDGAERLRVLLRLARLGTSDVKPLLADALEKGKPAVPCWGDSSEVAIELMQNASTPHGLWGLCCILGEAGRTDELAEAMERVGSFPNRQEFLIGHLAWIDPAQASSIIEVLEEHHRIKYPISSMELPGPLEELAEVLDKMGGVFVPPDGAVHPAVRAVLDFAKARQAGEAPDPVVFEKVREPQAWPALHCLAQVVAADGKADLAAKLAQEAETLRAEEIIQKTRWQNQAHEEGLKLALLGRTESLRAISSVDWPANRQIPSELCRALILKGDLGQALEVAQEYDVDASPDFLELLVLTHASRREWDEALQHWRHLPGDILKMRVGGAIVLGKRRAQVPDEELTRKLRELAETSRYAEALKTWARRRSVLV